MSFFENGNILDDLVDEVLKNQDFFETVGIRDDDCEKFNESVDDLDKITYVPELYLEAINTNSTKEKTDSVVTTTIKNTADTTKSAVDIASNITNIQGTSYKATYDLVAKSLNLITRVIGFFSRVINRIPVGLDKLVTKLGNIPTDIKSAIRGDIPLYLTVEDVNTMDNYILPEIKKFIDNANSITDGPVWKTVGNSFSTSGIKGLSTAVFGQTDIKRINEMKKSFDKLSKITFSKTTVVINPENIDVYFGNKSCIKSYTLKNEYKEFSYYEAIKNISEKLTAYKSDIVKLSEALTNKYNESQVEKTLNELSSGTRTKIVECVRMSSRIISIIGSFTNSVIQDQKTITDGLNTIDKKLSKKNKK